MRNSIRDTLSTGTVGEYKTFNSSDFVVSKFSAPKNPLSMVGTCEKNNTLLFKKYNTLVVI